METRRIQSRLTPVDDEYETCERTQATLRIATGAMPPDRVTELLNITPTGVTVLGKAARVTSRGSTHLGESNIWLLDSENFVTSKDLRRHVDWIISTVYSSREALFRLQEMPDVKMDVSCVWWSRHGGGGPTLWPEQMSRLAELNLEISVACAFYGEEIEPA